MGRFSLRREPDSNVRHPLPDPPSDQRPRPLHAQKHEPHEIEVADLDQLVAAKPRGEVRTSLDWAVLSLEDTQPMMAT